jgi:hypothetical protein
MKIRYLALAALLPLVAVAQDHHEGGRPPDGHAPAPVRGPPPQFRPHAPGGYPHGPPSHPHAVRILAPRAVVRGGHYWNHWAHPEFVRPLYYWNWGAIRGVTCIAEDSYGDQYPVTENGAGTFNPDYMTNLEDSALDRCYSESGGDQTCYLATCTHY